MAEVISNLPGILSLSYDLIKKTRMFWYNSFITLLLKKVIGLLQMTGTTDILLRVVHIESLTIGIQLSFP